jgi:hypothetical protein
MNLWTDTITVSMCVLLVQIQETGVPVETGVLNSKERNVVPGKYAVGVKYYSSGTSSPLIPIEKIIELTNSTEESVTKPVVIIPL